MERKQEKQQNLNAFILSTILKFVLPFLLIIFTVILIITFSIYNRNKIDEITRQNITLTQKIKTFIERKIEPINMMNDYIKVLELNKMLDLFHLNVMMQKVLDKDKNFNEIYIIIDTANVILPPEFSQYDHPYFSAKWYFNREQKFIFDTVDFNEVKQYFYPAKIANKTKFFKPEKINVLTEQTYTIPVAIPIKLGSQFTGVIIIKLNFDFLQDFLPKTEGDIIIYDPNTFEIFFSENNKFYIGKKVNKVYPDINFRDISFNLSSVIEKKNRITYVVSPVFIDNLTWKLMQEIPPQKNTFKQSLIITAIVAYLLLIPLILFISGNIAKKIAENAKIIQEELREIAMGEIVRTEIKKGYTITIVQLKKIVNYIDKIKNRHLNIIDTLNKISEQNFDVNIEEESEKDRVAQSLKKILNQFKERYVQEIQALKTQEENIWIRQGISQIHETTQLKEKNFETLANAVLENIVKYIDAYLGSIFIYNEENQKLTAIATFAYDKKKAFKKEIELGEGLIGTVALERKLTYLEKIPQNYQVVITGMGQIKPVSIILVPIIYENNFYGILELAFLKKLKNYEIEYLKQAVEILGLNFRAIKSSLETQKLLEEYEKQKQELEKTQEELKKNIEDLKKKEKKLLENEKKLQAYYETIYKTLLTLEYTPSGEILFVNDKFLDTLKFTREEVQGKSLFDIARNQEIAEGIREKLNLIKEKGKPIEGIIKRYTKYDEEVYIYATYTPFYDINGRLEKIIFLGFDITEHIKKIQKLEKEISYMRKQIKLLL